MTATETPEFGVLGALEIRSDGRLLPLGSPKQRALLALLLLHANETISRDRLIDELWGEAPPPSANSAFHVYLSRLRKLLGDRLVREADGYVLRIDPDRIDSVRFSRLAREGREALAEGDPQRAADVLNQALDLSRGPPLAGLSEPFATATAARLEEQYLAALEDRIDADLALGRHHALIGELDELVAAHPFRERLRAQQMLALYRSGRQAEALAAYRAARQLLSAELGLEPSSELRTLQQAILRQEPDLAAPHVPARRLRRPNRLPRVLIAAGLVAIPAAATAALLLARGASGDDAVLGANAVGLFRPDNGRLTAAIDVGTTPAAVTSGAGSIWIANVDDHTVSRIDAAKHATVETIAVGNGPNAVAVGGGFVWVANGLDGSVSKIDPQTNTVVQEIAVGNAPGSVATDTHGVWVANGRAGTVTQLDLRTGKPVRTILIGTSVNGIAAGFGSVWVTTEATGTVTRLDARTGAVVESVHTGSSADAVAIDRHAVWIANDLDGTVTRVDAATATVRATIPVGDGPNGIALDGTTVWVSNELSGTLSRIDANRNAVVQTVTTGNRPQGVVFHAGSLFVPVRASGVGHGGGTLRVLAPTLEFSSVDLADPIAPREALTITNDGLVGFRRVGGSAGTRLVPDLAVSLPTPTNGGRTYTFHLRPGIHYSTGAAVKPGDLRRALERTLVLNTVQGAYFRTIVGARRCATRRTQPCDLSRGIVTDEAAATITFHLTAPDPDFLYKLALPEAYAVPVATPLHVRGPLPATGPYRIVSFDWRRGIRLVRNPRFREWSPAAQPAGFPDVIVERFPGSPDQHVAAVLRRDADVADVVLPSAAVLDALRTQHASMLRINPWDVTWFLVMNTRVPPFDDVRVRRALNFALDRARLRDLTLGPGLGQVTCQVLPPHLDGYRRYCPYTIEPVVSGVWSGADIARARALVRESGTVGQTITVWIPNWSHFRPVAGRYVVALLEKLGYRARFRFADDPYAHWGALDLQIGFYGWVPDFATPAGFIPPALTCAAYVPRDPNNGNTAKFCDPAIDREIAHAQAVQVSNPDAASRAWAAVDRAVTDRAPWAPFANGVVFAVVSPRVHNFQYHPQWGTLLDQIWVR